MFKTEPHLHTLEVSPCAHVRAKELMRKYKEAIGGSDTHRNEDIALSGIETENEIKSAEDFIEAVKSGRAKIIM